MTMTTRRVPPPLYEDGEVIGIDTDGCLILWDNEHRESYNCGKTLGDFGEENLHAHERERLGLPPIRPAAT